MQTDVCQAILIVGISNLFPKECRKIMRLTLLPEFEINSYPCSYFQVMVLIFDNGPQFNFNYKCSLKQYLSA